MIVSPLRFEDLFVERVWGGNGLAQCLGKRIPEGRPIGESWEVSAYPGMVSVVAEGPYTGRPLNALCREFPREIIGESLLERGVQEFPLLLKFINAHALLSVQVHPDDDYAQRREGVPFGKCEMWYILRAEPGARVIYGLTEEVTPEKFHQAAKGGTIERYLHEVEVCEGDVVVIPPGCVHALGGGIIVCEVQESCDLTYRIYDWGRIGRDGKPRSIHLDKALEVIDFSMIRPKKGRPLVIADGGVKRQYLAACRHYAVQLIVIGERLNETTDRQTFQMLSVVGGSGRIIDRTGSQTTLRRGESLMLPAVTGQYQVERDEEPFTIIQAYAPDLLENIIKPLRQYGFSDDEIAGLGGEGQRNDLAEFLER